MKKKQRQTPASVHTDLEFWSKWSSKQVGYFLFFILLFTVVAYSNSFQHEFNLRDDQIYVTENPLLGDLSLTGLQRIFTTLYYNGHLPITILSLALDYHFWQLHPLGYHITSFVLHLANILLVFYFVICLTERKELALFCAFIFALHPMAAQSVVWISERKNVLYAFFFLLSLIFYTRYLKSEKKYFVLFSFLFFLCAVMSKWSAYTLPVNILLLNFFYRRKLNFKVIAEHLVFFAVPFISYFLHVQSGVEIEQRFTFLDRIFFGSYTFLFYLTKLVLPIQLSTIYPYPNKINHALPLIFYISLPIALLLLSTLVYYFQHNFWLKKYSWFGFLFFLINIGMVLQVIMLIGGHELAADRYGYIPFIGIFILLGELFFAGLKKITHASKWLLLFILLLGSFMISATRNRNLAWQNTASIYNDALEKYPEMPIAYLYRGEYFWKINDLQNAIKDFTTCIEKFPHYKFCFLDRGEIYLDNEKYNLAKADFISVLKIDSNNIYAHDFLGKIAVIEKAYQEAVKHYSITLQVDSNNAMAHNNMGYSLYNLKKYEQADMYFDRALSIDSTLRLAFLNKGWSYIEQQKYEKAIDNFNVAIRQNDSDALFFNNRGLAFFYLKHYDEALQDFHRSASLDPDLSYPFYNSALIYFEIHQNSMACENLQKAINIGHNEAQKMFEERCNHFFPKKIDKDTLNSNLNKL